MNADSPNRLRILCLHGFRQTGLNFQGRLSALRKRLKHVAEFVFMDAPFELPAVRSSHSNNNDVDSNIDGQVRPRRGWLLTPEQADLLQKLHGLECTPAENPETLLQQQQHCFVDMNTTFSPQQHVEQTIGWERSFMAIKDFVAVNGPFDGVLGFSQGASIAGEVVGLCYCSRCSVVNE